LVSEKEAIITEKLTKEFNYLIKLNQKDSDNAAKLADQTIRSLQARNSELEKQIADARMQESMSTQRVQQIAEKAIESATKQTVLVSNTASEQSNYNEKLRK
jgi:hypothetical protein